jgi:hypothetical protein
MCMVFLEYDMHLYYLWGLGKFLLFMEHARMLACDENLRENLLQILKNKKEKQICSKERHFRT